MGSYLKREAALCILFLRAKCAERPMRDAPASGKVLDPFGQVGVGRGDYFPIPQRGQVGEADPRGAVVEL